MSAQTSHGSVSFRYSRNARACGTNHSGNPDAKAKVVEQIFPEYHLYY